MASIKKGIIGGLSGSISNVVGVSNGSTNYLRKSKSKLANKSKVIIQHQVSSFMLVNEFMKDYHDLFVLGLNYLNLPSNYIKQQVLQGQKIRELTTYSKGYENGCMFFNSMIKSSMREVRYSLPFNRFSIWYKYPNFSTYLPNDWYLEGVLISKKNGITSTYKRTFPLGTYRIITPGALIGGSGLNLFLVRMFSPTLGQIGHVWFCSKIA